jgi:hypothetical protein
MQRAMPWPWVLIALGALAVGCTGGEVRVSSTLRDPAQPRPPKPDSARVYFLGAVPPGCAVDTIGYVTAEGGGPLPSRELTSALSRAARRMGGDAIVGLQSGVRLPMSTDTARSGAATPTGSISGTVVGFRDSSCAR